MIDVFVDDEAIKTGTTGPLSGDIVRTWYDGVSYALINGANITPGYILSAHEIDFGTIQIGSTKKDSVLVSNPGTDTLKITAISSTSPRFTCTPATMTLVPSGNAYVVATFSPQDTSDQSGFIVFTHNASGSPDTLTVKGKGSVEVGIDHDKTQIPVEYDLQQNYPNPFNPSTDIRFALPAASRVLLIIYDIVGREITTLVDGNIEAGYHTVLSGGTHPRWQAGYTLRSSACTIGWEIKDASG
jgi:hypothetical protein